ncbi:MAG: cytochrome c3 family protein [Kiritimatiellae bacterium]|nr:cytochrome c3 family protein [Kiritimatiellia bacterium]
MKRISLMLVLAALAGVRADVPRAGASHWNGGRTVPVHKLAPLDADGDKVSPTDRLPRPVSQVQTCGQCHDVAAMKGGSHFHTGLAPEDVEEGVRTEPWFLADEKTGTAIPLSLRGQAGVFAPREVGMSCWQWTKTFGRHFPGGGVGSDTNAMAEVAGDRQRWFVTGALEANCLACHQQGGYDSSEWARQVLRENWQGAATAASGLGVVEGMNERLEGTWDLATRPENPDDHLFKVPEKTVYDLRRFDAKNRCVFEVGKPRSENCLNCHSASQKDMPSHAIMGDVHLQRGMKCVDCHQNGMDHRVATKSCVSCHTGAKGAGPRPVHAGIPLVHFEKLACTVCHSGVTEGGELAQVRTARANRIGVYGRAQWATDVPHIVEPVFVKNAKGVVEPCRMAWPSYFCAMTNGVVKAPLGPDAVKDLKALGTTNAFSKAVVASALAELQAASKDGAFAYVGHGRLWTLDGSNLVSTAHAAAAPVSWPIAHDVRPARQARGAAPVKCADCHTADSEFFLGEIHPTGPMADADVEPLSQAELLGVCGGYHKVLGTTFGMRPLFKVFLWTVFGLICLFAAAAAALALNKFAKWLADNSTEFAWGLAKWIVDMGFVACLLYLLASGVIGWMCGAMTSWWLVLHMCAGGGFAACTVLMLAFRLAARTEKTGLAVVWMFWTVFAAGTVFTAVMPMMTVFGGHGQEVLLWCHRCVSLCFAAASCLVCRLCLRDRFPAKKK